MSWAQSSARQSPLGLPRSLPQCGAELCLQALPIQRLDPPAPHSPDLLWLLPGSCVLFLIQTA